jgi:galactokinase
VSAQKESQPTHELAQQFVQHYGVPPLVVEAPGRVNLIGEHTDYNDGFVLPAAIQFRTRVAIAARNDGRLVITSENYSEQVEFDMAELPGTARRHWSDYVVGVAHKLKEHGIDLPGANLLIHGNVPLGAGLSSSASLEVAACGAFLAASEAKLDRAEMARLCQRAENEFVGARCGIMDQFVSVHGKKDHALLLDCRSLEYRDVPLPEDVRLVICNTMVRHSLSGGEYNQRRKECETGAHFFEDKKPGVKALRDVSVEDFRKWEAEMPEVIRKRCRHVISEDARVIKAIEALGKTDVGLLGKLMRESHASLRDDFEVSCEELNVMVELAGKVEGVYGARMTGGGFGGCTINLVKSEAIEDFQAKVAEGYERATGRKPEIYVCRAADGVRRVVAQGSGR